MLTDINMPDVDGFTLVEQMRKRRSSCAMHVIVLTSGDRSGEQVALRQLGVAAHLMKPVKQSELLDAIVLALGVTVAEPDQPAPVGRNRRPAFRLCASCWPRTPMPTRCSPSACSSKRGHTRDASPTTARKRSTLLQAQAFDLVLMDVQMPEMDGLEATPDHPAAGSGGKLTLQARSPIPIIAMTAHAMKGDRERCLESGMTGYVSKPIRPRDLEEALAGSFASDNASPDGTPGHRSLPDIIDWSAALASVGGDAELLQIVASAFLTEANDHQTRLTAALASGDAATVHRLGHLLKGVLGTLGAASGRASAELLESMGRQGDLSAAAGTLRALQEQLRAVSDVLTAFVEGRISVNSQGERVES